MFQHSLTSSDKVVLSFAGLILLGTLLLHLPICSAGTHKIHLRDCFFTSTSAVCVTGLAVNDPGTDLSLFGQIVLLSLIQVGGLGILTLSNWLLLSLGKQRSPESRFTLKETHGSLPRIEPATLLKQIVLFTFFCEAIGALLLFTRFRLSHSFFHAFWLAVFHSISGFCNAGFSLFSNSLANYQGDLIVNFTLIFLIVAGGLGFLVFADLSRFFFCPKIDRRLLSFQSRVVLSTTAILIVAGTLIFFFLEGRNTLRSMGAGDRLLSSLFLSVTCRTAGFNTIDTGQLGNATLCVLMLLMGIGASPGSAGGGIKTTTFTVLVAFAWSRARGRERIEWMGRSLPLELVAKAVTTSAAFAALILFSVVFIEFVEVPSGAPGPSRGLFLEHLFEVVSALGTVGLSTGVTAKLSGSTQILLTVLMFTGRLGPLLIANSLVGRRRSSQYSLPEERMMVG